MLALISPHGPELCTRPTIVSPAHTDGCRWFLQETTRPLQVSRISISTVENIQHVTRSFIEKLASFVVPSSNTKILVLDYHTT